METTQRLKDIFIGLHDHGRDDVLTLLHVANGDINAPHLRVNAVTAVLSNMDTTGLPTDLVDKIHGYLNDAPPAAAESSGILPGHFLIEGAVELITALLE